MSTLQIKVSEVLGLLRAGKTRSEIGEMYNLNGVQLKELFKHPKLKNKKTVKEKGVAFQLIDDVEEAVSSNAVVESTTSSVVEESVVETVTEQEVPTNQSSDQDTPSSVVESPVVEEENPLWNNG